MYFIKKWFFRKLFKILKKTPDDMPMVQYWKTKSTVPAKVMMNKDGALVMKLEGEKEIFPGYPRSHSLYGTISKLKHEIKNQIFNESWAKLDQGVPIDQIAGDVKSKITKDLQKYMDACRYDMLPPEKMVRPVREIWRAFTVLEKRHPNLRLFKDALTFILQEDDAYRFRFQWLISIFNPSAWWFHFVNPIKYFELGLIEMENAEVIGDMKERIRLLRRVLLAVLQDKTFLTCFKELCREVNWNKVKLSKADKFHFRGKYFKVDLEKFEY